jgi:hypothetical protein
MLKEKIPQDTKWVERILPPSNTQKLKMQEG